MKYLALFAAYVALVTNISYYYQLQELGIALSFWRVIATITIPIVIFAIAFALGIVIIAVGMHYKWWKKPDLS